MTSSAKPVTSIAVIKPCCIGDCVMALPAAQALHAGFPDARIDVWVGAHSRAVFDMLTVPHHVVEIDDRPRVSSVPALARSLRGRAYDYIAILDRSRLLRIAARFTGARGVFAAEFQDDEGRHESDVYLDVVRLCGVTASMQLPLMVPPAVAQQTASARLGACERPRICLHPGGAQNPGAEMLDKRWPADRWIELARILDSDGFDVLLTGGTDDRDVSSRIATAIGLRSDSVLAAAMDIASTAAVIQHSELFIGGDTGMSHIAAAVGTPTVAIFGPTNPRRYRPLGPRVRVVAPDASWHVRDMDLRHSRGVDPEASIARVSVADVLDASRSLLGRVRDCR